MAPNGFRFQDVTKLRLTKWSIRKLKKKPEVNPSSTPRKPAKKESNVTKITKNITDVLSKLEEGNWKDKSIALMKTMLADTLILVSTIVVLFAGLSMFVQMHVFQVLLHKTY